MTQWMLLSEALGTTTRQLSKLGVNDSFLGLDSLLHVDPARLRATRLPELKGSYDRFRKYVGDTLEMIAAAKPGDVLERQAIERLVFPEIQEASLGYSKESTHGRGVTRAVAKNLYSTAKTIIDAGIRSPSIFELAVLFEKGFGADMISDMTVFVLLDELNRFNRRVADGLELDVKSKRVGNREAVLIRPKEHGRCVFLIPNSILADLPLALDWTGIDVVSDYNEGLRARLNKIVQESWGKRFNQRCKPDVKRLFLEHPDLLRELIKNYESAELKPYDFEKDPRGKVRWAAASRQCAKDYPLTLASPATTEEVMGVTRKICEQFKHLVEERGLRELLFHEGKPNPEKVSQLLFFGMADSYCRASNIDISRELQTGRGIADFKLSRGHRERVIVEVKLSSNAKSLEGLVEQLPTYLHAEQAKCGLLLVVRVGEHEQRLNKLRQEHARQIKLGGHVPELLVIDALPKPTASKLKRSQSS